MPVPDDHTPIPPASAIEVGLVRVPESAVRVQYSRASGPGGQNVNKVNSRCEIWVKVGAIDGLTDSARLRLRQMAGSRLTLADEIHLDAHERRSQVANREMALERLRELLLRAIVEPKKRKKTRPSYGSKKRRLESKRRRSEIKQGRRGAGHD